MSFLDNFTDLSSQFKQEADLNQDGEIDLRVSSFSHTTKKIETKPEYQISQRIIKNIFNINSNKAISIILNYFDKLDGLLDQKIHLKKLEQFLSDIQTIEATRIEFRDSLLKDFREIMSNKRYLDREKQDALIDLGYIIRSLDNNPSK